MIFAYFLFALYGVFPSKQLALAGVVTGLTLYNGAVIAEIVRSDLAYAVLMVSEAIDRFEVAASALDRAAETLQADRQRLTEEAHARLAADLRSNAVIGGAAALTALALAIAAARLISRPLMAMTAAMGRLAAGDRAVDIPGTDRRDEVGAMAAAMRVFRDNMAQADRLTAEQVRDRAAKERRQAAMDRHTRISAPPLPA